MLRMYSFYDTVAEEYLPIWQAKNDNQAKQIVNKARAENGDKVAYGDLRLYYLGDFDIETGVIFPAKPMHEVVFLDAEDN